MRITSNFKHPSLSARRAWIEISGLKRSIPDVGVALRKESVDRNDTVQIVIVVVHASLSARRAWIEILIFAWQVCLSCVALRKESVDRNIFLLPLVLISLKVALRKESVDRNTMRRDFKRLGLRRSPQGERG